MKEITIVGVDLAKTVFTVHGVDAMGRVLLRKTVRREQLVELIARLPPCLIGMEACGGAHEWGRKFQSFVAASGAARLHRAAHGDDQSDPRLAGRVWRGVAAARGTGPRAAVVMAEGLPVLAREAIVDLRAHLTYLDERITRYERQLVSLARQREAAVRIQRLPGVGPLTASAITASISDGHEFANGRQFAEQVRPAGGHPDNFAGRFLAD